MSKVKQNTPEWLEYRRTRIGASDAPIIMGVSPWRTPYQLWMDKISGEELPMNAAMLRGKNLENTALQVYEMMTGCVMQPYVAESLERPWQIASLDGMTYDKDAIVEIKCAGAKDHLLALEGKVPEKYMPQLQHQMCVTGLNKMDYFSFDGIDGVIIEIKRNNMFLSDLISAEEAFYKCLIEIIPPLLTNKDFKRIQKQLGSILS